MKKALSVAIAIMLVFALAVSISGCKNDPPPTPESTRNTERETTTPDASPVPPPPPPPDPLANGGQVQVTEACEISFTPSRSGVWVLRTADNGDSDPTLALKAPGGLQIAEDDDSAGGYNALIISELNAGTAYTIVAGFYADGDGAFTLIVTPAETIPSGGGEIRVNASTGYVFSPDEPGEWEFLTTDNGDDDPYLILFDTDGFQIAYDDDGGSGYNARIVEDLGKWTYYLFATGYDGTDASYLLTVSPAGEAPATEIPSGGGTVHIDGATTCVFTPNQSGIWTISTSSSDSSDPMLSIYDEYGSYIANDDDSGGGYDAYITINLSAGVTYSIEVSFFSGSSTTLSAVPGGNDFLSIEVQTPGEIPLTPQDETDSGIVIFFTSDNGSLDPVLRLYTSDGTLISEDDDGGDGLNSFLPALLLEGETYMLSTDNYGGSSGTYTLNLYLPVIFPSAGGEMNISHATGFTFTPIISGSYTIRTSNNGSDDPVLTILSSNGDYLADDDDSGGGLNSLITIDLQAGATYYIYCGFYQTGVGACTLSIGLG